MSELEASVMFALLRQYLLDQGWQYVQVSTGTNTPTLASRALPRELLEALTAWCEARRGLTVAQEPQLTGAWAHIPGAPWTTEWMFSVDQPPRFTNTTSMRHAAVVWQEPT